MASDNQYGEGETILSDKCDAHWHDLDCPRPATCGRFFTGQFGHKVVKLYCDECWAKPDYQRWMLECLDPEAVIPSHEALASEDESFETYSPEEGKELTRQWERLCG